MKHVPPIADLSPLTFRLAHSLLLSRFLSPAAPCLDVNARGLSEWTAALKEPPDSAIERFQAGEPVLVQPEMEKERSPLVSIPPVGGDFQGIRVFRSDGFRKQRKKQTPTLPIIVSMSPPGYPSAWLHPCSARFRFTRRVIVAPLVRIGEPILYAGLCCSDDGLRGA
jgi:hypothetical protein